MIFLERSSIIFAFATLSLLVCCIHGGRIPPSSRKLSPNLKQRLEEIRQLSKEAGLPQVELPLEDVCLDDGCLDAAFDLLRAINGSVDPCKNFYQYACGRWISSNPVPPTESTWARFHELIRNVNIVTQEILRQPQSEEDALPINQAKQFYNRCVDTEAMERAGLEPLREVLGRVGGWELLNPQGWNASGFDWLKASGLTFRHTFIPQYYQSQMPIYSILLMEDNKNSSRQGLYLAQGSLFLPRQILIAPENYTEFITAYENYIVEVAQELGSTQTEAQLRAEARSIIAFESSLAAIHPTEEAQRDFDRMYNPFNLDQYQAITDAVDPAREFTVDWKSLLNEIFSTAGVIVADDEPIIVNELEYVEKSIPILKATQAKTLNNYITWRLISQYVGETTKNMRDIQGRFMAVLTGAVGSKPREISCADKTNILLGFATGKKYLDTGVFDEEARDNMNGMVEKLLSSFIEMVREADWMQEESKTEAIAKAEVIRPFMGYPDWVHNKTALEKYYEGLEQDDNHFTNQMKAIEHLTIQALKRQRLPTDKDRWLMDPVTVNARFSYWVNSITFPTGILQPPFFHKSRPKHQNYGAVGVVIGHEITHGFDDVGSRFNRFGNLENWWDNVTKEEYQKRSQCMIDQYGGYLVEEVGLYLNGQNTLGENIGDNGGLRESYRGYQKYVEENGAELRLPGLEHLSTEQLFFLGYANIWCESTTPQGLIQQILTDPHSPAEFRVLGPLHNSDSFAQAYNCPVDPDGMNPPAEKKCTVW